MVKTKRYREGEGEVRECTRWKSNFVKTKSQVAKWRRTKANPGEKIRGREVGGKEKGAMALKKTLSHGMCLKRKLL